MVQRLLLVLLACWAGGISALPDRHLVQHQKEEVPHVDECGICMYCIADEKPKPFQISDLVPANFMPTDAHVKQKRPLCHHCRGCTTTLRVLVSAGQKKLFTTWFRDEAGASPSWLFVAPTDKTRNRKAIVKVACIPVGKHAAQKHHSCMPEVAAKYAKIYFMPRTILSPSS